jgi:hypothetical protein
VSGKESLSELMGAHRYRRSTLVVISMVTSITRRLEDKKEVVNILRCRCRDEGGKGSGEFGWNEFQGRFLVEERGPDARSASDGGFLSQRSTNCSG